MARPLEGRLLVAATLVCRTPLRVGGIEAEAAVDLGLTRDGWGRCYVPGTSLAGVLRRSAERVADPGLVEHLWGSGPVAETGGNGDGRKGYAARLTVDDAPVMLPTGATPEIRDGVGIDREWGGAAHGIKYDQAVLPRGTRIPLRLEVEIAPGRRAEVTRVMSSLLDLLRDEGLRLGGGGTRGLGRAVLDGEVNLTEMDLATRQGMFEALRSGGRRLSLDALRNGAPPAPRRGGRRLEVEIAWRPELPLLVKAGHDGSAVDALPLTGRRGGEGVTLVLPGSAIKGALRAHAERIVRTVLGRDVEEPPFDAPDRLARQAGLPLVSRLFGTAAERKGALAVDDCYALPACPPETWQAVETAGDDAVTGALEAAGLGEWRQAFHVAVDRWTGGAAEKRLFNVLEPHGTVWEPLRLSLDLERLGDERDAALALLLLTLRDLGRGRIPLGHGVNRGLGAVRVEGFQLRLRGAPAAEPDALHPLGDEFRLEGGDPLASLPPVTRRHLDDAWRRWVKEQMRGEGR